MEAATRMLISDRNLAERKLAAIVKAIRARVGTDFHLQMKISAEDHNDALALFKRGPSGNTLNESVQVCQWLEAARLIKPGWRRGLGRVPAPAGRFPRGSDRPGRARMRAAGSRTRPRS